MSQQEPQQLVIKLPGVVLPSWLAVCLLATAVLAAIALLLVWQTNVDNIRELRILQLHCADIENVLIRQGVATREDFVTRLPQKPETSNQKGSRE